MKVLLFIVLAVVFFSCTRNPLKVNVSKIDSKVNIVRVEKLLFETDTAMLEPRLSEFYPNNKEFFDIYTGNIIKVGIMGEEEMLPYLKKFVTDTVYSKVALSALDKFRDIKNIEKQIENGFKHYKYYYPNKEVPTVYTFFSGFVQPVFTAENIIGVGLDMYLGRECEYYKFLGIQQYKTKNMYPEKLVADMFYSLAFSEYDMVDSVDNLLSNMVYLGKLHYFTEAMCPTMHDSINIGYTSSQLKWCKNNEAKMWTYLIENKLIYSTERLTLQKFIGDAPFTNNFSQESPGRTGVWLGWQIVRTFMKNNKETTLDQLMRMNNAQEILARSKYFPN